VLGVLVQSRRDKQTAKRVLRKLLKRQMGALTGAGTSAPCLAIASRGPESGTTDERKREVRVFVTGVAG
jgi:transposase-like protein